MNNLELQKYLIKYGVLGPILVWFMWIHQGMIAKVFTVIENNTKVMESVSTSKFCKEQGQ